MKGINEAAHSTAVRRLPKLPSYAGKRVEPCAQAVSEVKRPEVPAWPEKSLESERLFGHAAAKLYPFIGRPVQTPMGSGVLWQAFAERSGVVLDAETGIVTFMSTKHILPGGTAA